MSTKKKIFIAVLGAEGVMIVMFIVLICYFGSSAVKANRQMEFAQRYLLDEDYERAIAAFDRIIEMDDDNAEAYIGIAEAYAENGALEKTVEILEKGSWRVKESDSYEIQAVLDRYKEELEQLKASQEADSGMAEVSQPEPTEAAVDSGAQPEAEVVVNTGFITQDGDVYYYDELGSLVVGWFEVDGSRYYAGADGKLYRNGEYEVDSVKYLFGQEGICVEEVKDEAWKQAYIDFIQQEHQDYIELMEEDWPEFPLDLSSYGLVYIDDDDIPELVGDYPNPGIFGDGCTILYYSNGMVKSNGFVGDFSYMERKNIIRMWYHDYRLYDNYETLYSENEVFVKIMNNEIVEVAEASTRWREDNPNDRMYFWDDVEISEENFKRRYEEMSYNEEQANLSERFYTYEQIIDLIRKY